MDPVTKAKDVACLVEVGDLCSRQGGLREAILWHRQAATRGEAALTAVAAGLARIGELVRDYWPTPQHAGGCGHQYDEAYFCRCGYLAEVKARDEVLRLCQLDSDDCTV